MNNPNPPSKNPSEPSTDELIEISRSMLFKDSENTTSPHEWRLCKRLEAQQQEIKDLKSLPEIFKMSGVIGQNIKLSAQLTTANQQLETLQGLYDDLKEDNSEKHTECLAVGCANEQLKERIKDLEDKDRS